MILLAACVRTPPPAVPPETLIVAGEPAMSPLLDRLARAFEAQNRSVTVVIEEQRAPAGEGAAALAAVAGTPPEGVWAAPIAVDAVAVVVHPDNPLETLTLAQLYDLFAGRTWHWSELGEPGALPGGPSTRPGGPAADEIEVLSLQENSPTRAAFEAQVMAQGPGCRPVVALKLNSVPLERTPAAEERTEGRHALCEPDPVTSTALLRVDGAAVVAYVAEHPAAIGYAAHGLLSGQVKALRVENVPPTPAHVTEGSYRLSLPFYLVAPQEPTGAARQFVDYCLSDQGQSIVAQRYAPVRGR